MKKNNKNLLKISELAEAAGVSLPTIKHYLNEGLLPKPMKTGRTMAYYPKSCVKRIILIRKLQQEKFLPLSVIKRVIDQTGSKENAITISNTIFNLNNGEEDCPPVTQEHIEERTGFSLDKLELMEKEGMIFPLNTEKGKVYDSTDLQIIEILKKREEYNLPFDYSIDTLKAYCVALNNAMNENKKRFTKELLGETFIPEITAILNNSDNSVTRFIILIRQRLLSIQWMEGIRQWNEFAGNLPLLNPLPLKCKEMPVTPPETAKPDIIYRFLIGDYEGLEQLVQRKGQKIGSFFVYFSILAAIAKGDYDSALKKAQDYIPTPTNRSLENTAAAMAYAFSIKEKGDISESLFFIKKSMRHLKRIETDTFSSPVAEMFCKYICGGIYTFLPDYFYLYETGMKMLERVEHLMIATDLKSLNLPNWLIKTITYEIYPALQIRIHRFIAECRLRQKDYANSMIRLEKIIELTDPKDKLSKWARLKKLEIKKAP